MKPKKTFRKFIFTIFCVAIFLAPFIFGCGGGSSGGGTIDPGSQANQTYEVSGNVALEEIDQSNLAPSIQSSRLSSKEGGVPANRPDGDALAGLSSKDDGVPEVQKPANPPHGDALGEPSKLAIASGSNVNFGGLIARILASDKNLIGTSILDNKGNFRFEKIPPGKDFLIEIGNSSDFEKSRIKFYFVLETLAETRKNLIVNEETTVVWLILNEAKKIGKKITVADFKDSNLSSQLQEGIAIFKKTIKNPLKEPSDSNPELISTVKGIATGIPASGPQNLLLPAPQNLKAIPGENKVSLSWDAISSATSYNVYWATAPGVVKGNEKLAATAASIEHQNLQNRAKYFYGVTAVYPAGESHISAEVSALLPVGAPQPPGNLKAFLREGKIVLSWDTFPGLSYNIYWASSPFVFPNGSKIENALPPFESSNQELGSSYYFVLTSKNSNGESTGSAQIGATADDKFEENDDFGRAGDLGQIGGKVTFENLIMADRLDYFKFFLRKRGQIGDHVKISFSNSRGNMDLRLVDKNQKFLGFSNGIVDEEKISLNGLLPGTYYIHVYESELKKTSSYSMELLTGGDDRALSGITMNYPTITVLPGIFYDLTNLSVRANYLDNSSATVSNVTWKVKEGQGTISGNTYTVPTSGNHTLSCEYSEDAITKSADLAVSVVSPAKFSGSVIDAVNQSPILSATVKASKFGHQYSATTDSDGQFSIQVPPGGENLLEFSRSDYIPAIYQTDLVNSDQLVFLELVQLVKTSYSGLGGASGTLIDALNGHPVDGAQVSLRSGINVKSGPVITSTTTDSSGTYHFSGLQPGIYTGEITKAGTNTNYMTIVSVGGITIGNQNGTLSPTGASSLIRIILTWGYKPSDLDSHLTGPIKDSPERFHLYYPYAVNTNSGSPGSNNPWKTFVTLDRDDVTSYGPETVTIIQQLDGIYRYYVHDFSNLNSSGSTSLSKSGARVVVYRGGELLKTLNVPNQPGTIWTVFELQGTTLTPVNTVSFQANTSTLPSIRAPFDSLDDQVRPKHSHGGSPREGDHGLLDYLPRKH